MVLKAWCSVKYVIFFNDYLKEYLHFFFLSEKMGYQIIDKKYDYIIFSYLKSGAGLDVIQSSWKQDSLYYQYFSFAIAFFY